VQVWHAFSGQHILTYTGHENDFVSALAWSPDGTSIASGDLASKVIIWNAFNGMTRMSYTDDIGIPVDALAWSPVSNTIAIGRRNGTVQLLDVSVSNISLSLTYKGHTQDVDALAWSPDGKYIASGSWDQTVQVWNAKDGTTLFTYRGHSSIVDSVGTARCKFVNWTCIHNLVFLAPDTPVMASL
jgi:WD40 repeat protein